MRSFQLFLTFVCIQFLVSFLSLDNSNAQSLGVGIKGGPNFSSHLNNFRYVSGDIDLELIPEVSTGYNIGLIIRTGINENFRFQLEPSLVSLGATYNEGFVLRDFNFQTESETNLLYIQLPILFQLTTSPTERTVYGRPYSDTTFHMSGGIYGSYLVSAQFRGTNSGTPIGINFTGDFANDVKDQYLEYDAGFMVGVGLENGNRNKFGFDARLMFSVINNGNTTGYSFDPKNIGAVLSFYLIL